MIPVIRLNYVTPHNSPVEALILNVRAFRDRAYKEVLKLNEYIRVGP